MSASECKRRDRKLLVVSGLRREARAAGGQGVATICSGGNSQRLRGALQRLDPAGFWGVMSFGIAGGLDPALAPGDILVGTAVHHGADRHCARNRLSTAVASHLHRRNATVETGLFAGSEEMVLRVEDKAALRERTGAVAVDTESHVAAEWAGRHQLPFSILRVVSDPAYRALPPLAAQALRPDGRIDLARVILDLARSPQQISLMADAGRDARAAFAALGRCRSLFGPLLRLRFSDF